ncbi:MAG TPA: tRNA 2-thiouridine(34) synthase MnmA [Actinomycetota bacterium]|jgi:tRNA-specific 2-thiouridylase
MNTTPPVRPKAVVAMSGGVDSSVAAALMRDAGYDVVGIMLKLWRGPAANNESGCCSLDAAEDARRVAQVLDIPFYVFNFAERFERTVVASFVAGYAAGRTPNPCIDCNRWIKFSALLERARAVGADVLATGHYARIASDGERRRLLRGRDPGKDQSYVLHMLGQDELRSARFPVGEYAKAEVREIAASLGLRTAGKPESQDLCFVPAGDTHAFLGEAVGGGSVPGPILSLTGERMGTHRGFAHYTVGQRRGLGLGGRGGGLPLFVHSIRPADNAVVVAASDELRVQSVELEDVSFVAGEPPRGSGTEAAFEATVMTRYRGPEAAAVVEPVRAGRWRVTFGEPQRIVAPGQAAVFYRGDEVLGGGTVAST